MGAITTPGEGRRSELSRHPHLRSGDYSAKPVSRDELLLHSLGSQRDRLRARIPPLAVLGRRFIAFPDHVWTDASPVRVAAQEREMSVALGTRRAFSHAHAALREQRGRLLRLDRLQLVVGEQLRWRTTLGPPRQLLR